MEQLLYVAQDGRQALLTDYTAAQGWLVVARRGFSAPPQSALTEPLPGAPGTRWTGSRVGERTVALDLRVAARSLEEALARISTLASILMQNGQFRATANGATRVLDVVYNGGLEGDTAARSGQVYQFTPEWRAPQPYWRAAAPVTTTLALAAAPTGVRFPAAFPLFFGQAGQSAQVVLTGGDVPSPWQAAVQGPCTGLVLANLLTREVLALRNLAVGPGQVLRLDTQPGARRIWFDNGWTCQDVTGGLTPDSQFWLLAPGPNLVGVQVLGGPQAVVTFAVTPWYLGEA